LIKESLTVYHHLVQLHYLEPGTGELMEVTNTYEDKVTGKLMATAIDVTQRQQVYNLSDVRHKRRRILGKGGIAELVVAYGQSRIGSSEEWPVSDEGWLRAQTRDPYWAEVAARLVDTSLMIPLASSDTIVEYLYRELREDGTVGPIRCRLQLVG
jgi:hypothetical protein